MKANNNVIVSAAAYKGTAMFFVGREPKIVDFKQSGARSKRDAKAMISREYGVPVDGISIELERESIKLEFDASVDDIINALAAAGINPISE